MATVYQYPDDFTQTLQEYIYHMSQDSPPSQGTPYRKRRPGMSNWDDAINEASDIADEVFDAFAEQMKNAVSSKLTKEIAFNCGIFACKLALYTIVRVGSDHGLYGHF